MLNDSIESTGLNFLIEALYLAADRKGAAVVVAEALQLHPNHWFLHVTAARVIATLGDYPEALRHMRLADLLYPNPDLSLLGGTAYIHALAGRKEESLELLAQISSRAAGEYVPGITLAAVHAALGDKDRAVDHIERACAGNEWYISGLKRDCCMDPLRTDPRFRRVLSQVGI
jgi:tetratricopeptide (TPR) repeat protein